jgi:hypothetical protein
VGSHVLVGGAAERELVRLVELAGGEVVAPLVDDRSVQFAVRALEEAIEAGEDEGRQRGHGVILRCVAGRFSRGTEWSPHGSRIRLRRALMAGAIRPQPAPVK